MFKISTSEFGTMGVRRRIRACIDEFLATVTEGVVHSVYKVVSQSVDIRRVEVNGHFATVSQGRIQTLTIVEELGCFAKHL